MLYVLCGMVESHGASVVGGDGSPVPVDGGRRDKPRMLVHAHDDVPAVVVDVGVAGRAQQAPIAQAGFAVVAPMHDVMSMGASRWCAAFDAALITQIQGLA